MKIKLIIGLPGSGKSYYLENNVPDYYHKIDDITTLDDLPEDAVYLAIADPFLCMSTVMGACHVHLRNLYSDPIFEYIYFENNPERALKNVDYRNQEYKKVTNFINQLTEVYEPVEPTLTIWNKNG